METPLIILSKEIQWQIIIRLSADELLSMLQVNHLLSDLAKTIYRHRRSLEFYQVEFKESCLWNHLQKIVDGKLNEYFEAFVPRSWLNELRPEYLKTTRALIEEVGKPLSQLQPNVSFEILGKEKKDLIVKLNNQSIQNFLAIPPSTVTEFEKILTVARSYRHVEATLQLCLLFLLINRFVATSGAFFIIDGCLSRWLTGSSLGLLIGEAGNKEILPHLINCALGQSDILSRHPKQQDLLISNAQTFLYRLTDNDCFVLAVTQGTVLVNAITRRCFHIIDRFGEKTLIYVIEANPNDEMLLALLGRFEPARLAKILPDTKTEDFQIVVENCRQFMAQLLSELSIEQLCEMVKPLIDKQFSCLINGKPFLTFLEKLNQFAVIEQPSTSNNQLLLGSEPSLKITCDPRTLLLEFVKLKSYFINEVIKSRCAIYLLPSDILGFLKRFPDLWDVLLVDVLDKFTAQELLALAAINIKAVPCIVEGYLESKFTDLKDFVEFVLRYKDCMSEPLKNKCKEAADAHFKTWVYTSEKEDTYTYIYWYILFPNKYPNLLDNITDNWLIQLRGKCQSGVHDTLLKKIGDLQNIKAAKKQIGVPKNPDNPMALGNLTPSNIPKTYSSSPTLPASEQHIPASEPKKAQESVQPMPKKLLQNEENKKQNNIYSLVAMSILKGFLIGVLVTVIATLLLMFMNYEMNVSLTEIINELWMAGVAGIFAEIVATACYLSEAKVFEPSSYRSASQEPDNPSGSFNALIQSDPTINLADGSKPFFPDVETIYVPKPLVQQTPAQAPVD